MAMGREFSGRMVFAFSAAGVVAVVCSCKFRGHKQFIAHSKRHSPKVARAAIQRDDKARRYASCGQRNGWFDFVGRELLCDCDSTINNWTTSHSNQQRSGYKPSRRKRSGLDE